MTQTPTSPTERDAMAFVEAYSLGGSSARGSPSIPTRRVIAALKCAGLKRSEFHARLQRGQAVGTPKTHTACAVLISQARLMMLCGLSVHVLDRHEGRESAFVNTLPPGVEPRIIVYARVSSTL